MPGFWPGLKRLFGRVQDPDGELLAPRYVSGVFFIGLGLTAAFAGRERK